MIQAEAVVKPVLEWFGIHLQLRSVQRLAAEHASTRAQWLVAARPCRDQHASARASHLEA